MLGQLLLGHVVGDYLLQTSWMAKNKSKPDLLGWVVVIIHSIIYTLSIGLLMWNFSWEWMVAVFLSHVFIDHYSIGTWYLEKIKGMPKPKRYDPVDYTSLYWIIYVAVDNGMHILLMYLAYNLIF